MNDSLLKKAVTNQLSNEQVAKLYDTSSKKEALYSLLDYFLTGDSSLWKNSSASKSALPVDPYSVLLAIVEVLLGKADASTREVLQSFYDQFSSQEDKNVR